MKRCVFAAAVCFSATFAWASDGPSIPVDVRAKGSQTVVVATVTAVHPRFGTNSFGDQVILSDLQMDVAETMKGQAGATLTVTVEGGQIGDLTLKVSDMPVMQPGERAIFFLERSAGNLVLHGRGSGVLKVDRGDRIPDSNLTVDDVRRTVRAAGR
jgi:hypothetical protein